MVDVSAKPETVRSATASALVTMSAITADTIGGGAESKKGDVLQVARMGGIAGAKQCASLIPLCHPVRMTGITVDFEFVDLQTLRIVATVDAVDRTGVEMEALSAVSAAALTVYDMCKSLDRGMEIRAIRLESKSGGRSGDYRRQG